MYFFKLFTCLLVVGFILVKVYTITTKFSEKRIIEVNEQITKDATLPLKGINADNNSIIKFTTTVTPIDFWDKLLLTNEDGNLLSELFKITVGLALVWFVMRLNYNNIFSKGSLNNFNLLLCSIVAVFTAFQIGGDHTRDYAYDIITKYNKTAYWIDKHKAYPHREYLYFFICIQIPFYWIISFYRVFVDHHAEKPDEIETKKILIDEN